MSSQSQRPRLLIATSNQGKLKEIRGMLSRCDLDIVGLADVDVSLDVAETGSTFAENAALKATAYASLTATWTLSDDSGLEVSSLGGAPGISSARYAGEQASDAERIEKLLGEMKKSGSEDRSARFVCAVAVADEIGTVRFVSEGECRGAIAESPIGKGGFGYDPIFVPEGFDSTFGELPSDVKDRVSHRRRALEKIIPYLLDFFGISA